MAHTHTHTHARTSIHPTCTAAHTHTRTHNTCCICDPFLRWTGNGNFCKCKSAGLKIQRINVHHMWHSGRMEDILTAGGGVGREERGSPGVSPTTERETHTPTHTHVSTHSCTEATPRWLQNSSFFTLSLFHKHHLGVVLEVVSFQEHPLPSGGGTRLQTLLIHQRQLLGRSLGCGREKRNRPHRSANTHPLPMQTWASRLRLNHYLDSFHRAAGKAVNFYLLMPEISCLFASK